MRVTIKSAAAAGLGLALSFGSVAAGEGSAILTATCRPPEPAFA